MTVPEKLYKYCPVGVYSLRAIVQAEINHCAPVRFNDPLDCNPTLQIDTGKDELTTLLRNMLSHVDDLEFEKEIGLLEGIVLNIENEEERDAKFCRLISQKVLQALRSDLGQRGVLSLSQNWNKPLMWSHYADQHHGICIEYDTKGHNFPNLGQVDYNSRRSISANDLYQWKVKSNQHSAKRVYDTYFFAKAPEWQYEEEWRDIAEEAGVHDREFDISAIYFGIRTDPVWETTIVKMLNKDRNIKLFKVSAGEDKFELLAEEVNREAIEEQGIAQPNAAIIEMLNKKPSRVVELEKQDMHVDVKPSNVFAAMSKLSTYPNPQFVPVDPALTGGMTGAASRAVTQALTGGIAAKRGVGLESHVEKALREAVEGVGAKLKPETAVDKALREAVEGFGAQLKAETPADRLLREAVEEVTKGKKGGRLL